MRIPLHPAGLREISLLTVLLGLPAAVLAWWAASGGAVWLWIPTGLLGILWMSGLAFFRDPQRRVPDEPGLLVAPADGKVVEISRLPAHELIGGPAMRVGIFLSVFDVHVNRSPCAGTVRSVDYRPGAFLDARDPDSGPKNEANTILIEPDDPGVGPIVVRQIAGLIARRIVCTVKVGQHLERGQRLGLIKFGSRTELIVPGHDRYDIAVQIGDRARGASTIMARQAKPASADADAGRREPAAVRH